jgi:hypothetical protein
MSLYRTAKSANYVPSLHSISSSHLGPNILLSDFYWGRYYVYERRRLRYMHSLPQWHWYYSYTLTQFIWAYTYVTSAVAQLVAALHYKPEGRGFDSR